MQKNYKYILIVVLVACYAYSLLCDEVGFGYSKTSEWWTRLTYLFFHGNFFHLLFNCWAMFALLSIMERETTFCGLFLVVSSLVGGVLGTFGSEYELQTIGISGSAFFLMGMRVYYYRGKLWIRSVVAILLAQMVLPLFSPVNTKIHCLCFIYGIGYVFIISKIKRYLRRKRDEKTMEIY